MRLALILSGLFLSAAAVVAFLAAAVVNAPPQLTTKESIAQHCAKEFLYNVDAQQRCTLAMALKLVYEQRNKQMGSK